MSRNFLAADFWPRIAADDADQILNVERRDWNHELTRKNTNEDQRPKTKDQRPKTKDQRPKTKDPSPKPKAQN
jgi:hypothetical protein